MLTRTIVKFCNRSRIPHYSYEVLSTWFRSGSHAFSTKVMKYFLLRVRLDLELLEEQGFVASIRFESFEARGL